MKGIILVAGEGARMSESPVNKCLSIVDNKTLLAHNIERLLLMGVNEIIIVVGKDGDRIKKHIESFQKNAEISFAEQKIQLGIVNAIKCALPLIGKDDFVLCLGDEIFFNQKPVEMLEYFIYTGADCVCAIVADESENEIRKCYSVLVDESNNILDLTEKPEKPFNTLKGTGFCIFKNRTLDCIEQVKANLKSGQYELCDWIKICIGEGLNCKAFDFAEKEFNINTLDDLTQANEYLNSKSQKK